MSDQKLKQEMLEAARRAKNPAAGQKQTVFVPLDAAQACVGKDHPCLQDCPCSEHKDVRNGPRTFVEVPLDEWIAALEGKSQESRDKSRESKPNSAK